MSKKFLFSASVDDIYRLLQNMPPSKDVIILSAWNGSYHDSSSSYYVSVKRRSMEDVERAALMAGARLISARGYGKLLKDAEFVPQEKFISSYENFRGTEITAIDRRLRAEGE